MHLRHGLYHDCMTMLLDFILYDFFIQRFQVNRPILRCIIFGSSKISIQAIDEPSTASMGGGANSAILRVWSMSPYFQKHKPRDRFSLSAFQIFSSLLSVCAVVRNMFRTTKSMTCKTPLSFETIPMWSDQLAVIP